MEAGGGWRAPEGGRRVTWEAEVGAAEQPNSLGRVLLRGWGARPAGQLEARCAGGGVAGDPLREGATGPRSQRALGRQGRARRGCGGLRGTRLELKVEDGVLTMR